MLKPSKWLVLGILCFCACNLSPPDVYVFESLEQQLIVDDNGHMILRPSPTCMEKISEPECGHGIAIVSGNEIFVGEKALFNKKPWSLLKKQSIYMPAEESYAPLSAFIINMCKKNGCGEQAKAYHSRLSKIIKL